MTINFFEARKKLIYLWLIGSAILFLFFSFQTLGGRYIGIETEAWGWFLPNFFPTLLLMVGAFFGNIGRETAQVQIINKSYYIICLFLSSFYLCILFLILLLYSKSHRNILDYYRGNTIILTTIQSVVTLCIGAFFSKSEISSQ